MNRNPWHRGAHKRLAATVNRIAYANRQTICLGGCVCHARYIDQCGCGMACGKTLQQHPPTKAGRPPKWSAGHRWAGIVATSLDDYRHEVLGCNGRDGARRANRLRTHTTTRDW